MCQRLTQASISILGFLAEIIDREIVPLPDSWWEVCPVKAGMFSGRQSQRGKSQSPVAWVASVEETKPVKPTEKAIFGIVSKSPGRSVSEPTGGSPREGDSGQNSEVGGPRRFGGLPVVTRADTQLAANWSTKLVRILSGRKPFHDLHERAPGRLKGCRQILVAVNRRHVPAPVRQQVNSLVEHGFKPRA